MRAQRDKSLVLASRRVLFVSKRLQRRTFAEVAHDELTMALKPAQSQQHVGANHWQGPPVSSFSENIRWVVINVSEFNAYEFSATKLVQRPASRYF